MYRGLVLVNLVFDVIYSSVWCLDCQQGLVVASKLEVSRLDKGSVNGVLY